MLISGFHPLSLLDYPGIICSIVFTQGCPFRCGYCHNPELVPIQTMNSSGKIKEGQVIEFLQKQTHILEGVCITGGEPTIHPDLPDFIKKLKNIGMLVKLDTNGINPRMIETLIKEQLVDFLAMDLKHTWKNYPRIIGIKSKAVVSNCRKTIEIIQQSGIQHEFRTTVYPDQHQEQDLEEIAAQLKKDERYALQQIRYGKTLNPGLKQVTPFDLEAIADRIRHKYPRLHIEVRA